jgi:hypothetical protein
VLAAVLSVFVLSAGAAAEEPAEPPPHAASDTAISAERIAANTFFFMFRSSLKIVDII